MNPDFRDMIGLLLRNKAKFLIVGAHAMAAHGVPRATGDIDIWIDRRLENSQRVWDSLVEFGAPLETLSLNDLQAEDLVIQFGVPPGRIDLLTHIDGIVFSDAYANRTNIKIPGLDEAVPVLNRNDLITNKRATGRTKDQLDIDMLLKQIDLDRN